MRSYCSSSVTLLLILACYHSHLPSNVNFFHKHLHQFAAGLHHHDLAYKAGHGKLREMYIGYAQREVLLVAETERKTKKVVLSDSEDEEIKNQGRNIQDINDNPLVSLVRDYMEEKEVDFVTPTKVSAFRGSYKRKKLVLQSWKQLKPYHKLFLKLVVEPKIPHATSIFDDEDITMAQTLIKMKEVKAKEKGVLIKDVEDSLRPERSVLTLKPLPIIDPKDKEIEREKEERQKQDQAYVDYIANLYDEVQAEINVDALFAAKLQQEEREEYTIEESAKFLVETIAAQRKFRATQRSAEIRSRPPTKSQLRNSMMTYLRHMGGFKHYQLKLKTFEEIQGLYERQKRIIDDFKLMDLNDAVKDTKEAAGVHKEKVLEEPDSTKIEVKQEEHTKSTRKRSGRRLKMKATKRSKRKKTDSDLEEEKELKVFLKIVPDEEGEVDYEVLDKKYPIVNWESKFYHTDRYGKPHEYYKVFRFDGSSRSIKTFSEMVTRFDRMDLEELYNLVMRRFATTTPEGIDLILWGSLRTMFKANADDDLWKNQEKWILKSWNFYEKCGVHILMLEDSTEFYMLAEGRYPLTTETLERMLALRIVAESESKAVFDLLRFIQKQINKSRSHDGGEEDFTTIRSSSKSSLKKCLDTIRKQDSELKGKLKDLEVNNVKF
ncbi:hypothetical protein Tco_1553593 [Tanacetum coccineum]